MNRSRLAILVVIMSLSMLNANSGLRSAPSPAAGYLFLANQYNHTALLVDLSTGKTLFTAGVDINGHEVAVSSDGRFGYVPIYGNSAVGKPGTDGSTIQVVDLRSGKVVDIIELPKAVRPHLAKFGPDGLLYVTAELANAVYVVDVHTKKVAAEIPTGQPESHMLAISPDGSRAYTSNVSSGTVSVLDLRKHTVVTTIPVADKIQRISLSPDGRQLFTHDQLKPRIAVIDTSTNAVSRWLETPATVYSSASTPDGAFLIANSPSGKLFVLDLKSGKLVHSYDIPPAVGAIAISPQGSRAYITCPAAGTIEVLNTESWQLEDPIHATPGVDGIAWFPALAR